MYHSVYETFELVDRFYDPTFRRMEAVTRVRGGVAFRLADAPLLPLNCTEYALALSQYAHVIHRLAQKHPQEMERYAVTFGETHTHSERGCFQRQSVVTLHPHFLVFNLKFTCEGTQVLQRPNQGEGNLLVRTSAALMHAALRSRH